MMKKYKKTLVFLTFLLCIVLTVFTIQINAKADDNQITLTISGNGVDHEVQITVAQLKALPQVSYTYSGYNHWPSLQVFSNATGPTLKSILDLAGLKEEATLVKFAPSTGGYHTYTVKELFKDERFYYPEGETGDLSSWPPYRTEEGKSSVETIIGITCAGGKNVYGKLLYGQRAPLEPTACKSEQMEGILPGGRILVTTETPAQWEAPDAYPGSGIVVPGTAVKLQHGDGTPYGALVYYTLDGSEPTVKSNIANISYPDFQPQLNAPIPITKDVTIKAKTIGIGKMDSPTVTYTYTLGKMACTVQGAGLMQDYALETLKYMSPAVRTYDVLEGGNNITITGKGVLLGTLLDELSASNLWEVQFVDTSGKQYNGGTVQDIKSQNCMLAYEVNGNAVEDVSGGITSYIQIVRNYNTSTHEGNLLKNIQTIRLVNVDDQITIKSVKLHNCKDEAITSVAPGGGYRIQVELLNDLNAAQDALLVIKVRSGDDATALGGGDIIEYAALQSVIPPDGNSVTVEFTMPANINGKAFVDVLILDNLKGNNSLGADKHDLSFSIR